AGGQARAQLGAQAVERLVEQAALEAAARARLRRRALVGRRVVGARVGGLARFLLHRRHPSRRYRYWRMRRDETNEIQASRVLYTGSPKARQPRSPSASHGQRRWA